MIGRDVKVFSELYQKAGLDTRKLFDENKFDELYAYRDINMENKLEAFRKEQNKYQMISIVGALPFFAVGLHKLSPVWSTPGFVLIGATKYYAIKNFYKQMEQEGVNDYWKKSKKL